MRAYVAFIVGMLVGLFIANLAHAELENDHSWISSNPKYTERFNHQTHCCDAGVGGHCRPANELGVVITPTPAGDWDVRGGPLQKPELIPAADTYQTERPGGLKAWICIWNWRAPGEQVACLFMPMPGT